MHYTVFELIAAYPGDFLLSWALCGLLMYLYRAGGTWVRVYAVSLYLTILAASLMIGFSR